MNESPWLYNFILQYERVGSLEKTFVGADKIREFKKFKNVLINESDETFGFFMSNVGFSPNTISDFRSSISEYNLLIVLLQSFK
ncbi:hypothetical protein C2G38_2252618 [Gigaspora rosea]|uniref:Uncharacterized protein n=1 Tax=Gigaspora rosea TaxID=44941 RepID=A0A397UCW5_9GLOM|nr:hypothetical protein C2G38_2252618 [Gigaspora rosea]